jgi:hypothetical protein
VRKTVNGYVTGKPIEVIPQKLNMIPEFFRNFGGEAAAEYPKSWNSAKNTVASAASSAVSSVANKLKPDQGSYDALKTRTKYPSFGSK